MSKTDLIIVGSGILGLATAFRAHQQGRTVHVIDRSSRPVGSSIQNFGHACFTGQADEIQDLAMTSRAGWREAAAATGIWAAETGSIVPAMTEPELTVLQQFADHRGAAQATMLSAEEVATSVGNPNLGAIGGAHLPLDMRVDPREAVPAIADWLADQGVDFTWNTTVTEVADGTASTNRGDFHGEQVIVCPGYQLSSLFPDIAEAHGVRICTLVMSLIERPQRIPSGFAMLTGTSLARYDGFAAMPGASALREDLARREPDLVDVIANLMVTDIPGGLLIGDSHAYTLSPEPFIDERVGDLLLDRATSILGIDEPVVRQRWLGQYADSTDTNFILERPDERTTVAVVTSGIGMTLSFGIADRILGEEAAAARTRPAPHSPPLTPTADEVVMSDR
ncbi:MAG: TIGR03364 family FAD-dependent oxidoreductase [Brevibacterium sp.]|nr:TIGR03364 family FAD-dependent oxidoreductase [Brevibacterium sp.]MDN5876616.1 TIGR03364 family FAD-dependent oxidoreductase [Brevibacterium sp.]MDN5908720.1 TIGR03364 family FAD-dependent oxidoreductase [Brevibacterium sp.]MDN6174000.1 TIGR03364 family FAD-dependent oxidoreductase [Brevibacterium sp.]MDN6188741.1 TIGR03364 family FAD-dependent oxidoreductase [Brevibacterium sp.]